MRLNPKSSGSTVEILPGETMTVLATINTRTVDSEGEVLLPRGCNLKRFKSNPVVLADHQNKTANAVGKVTAIEVTNDYIRVKIQFMSRPESFPITAEWLPETLFAKYKSGVLRAFSVGPAPECQWRHPTPKDREDYGMDVVRVITRWELMELTCTPVPMNELALVGGVSAKSVSRPVRVVIRSATTEDLAAKEMAEIRAAIQRVTGERWERYYR